MKQQGQLQQNLFGAGERFRDKWLEEFRRTSWNLHNLGGVGLDSSGEDFPQTCKIKYLCYIYYEQHECMCDLWADLPVGPQIVIENVEIVFF